VHQVQNSVEKLVQSLANSSIEQEQATARDVTKAAGKKKEKGRGRERQSDGQ
jgi:hypothetical protein